MVKISPDKYTKHGKLWRHVGGGPAIKETCEDCGDDLYNKNGKFPFKGGWICKHCMTTGLGMVSVLCKQMIEDIQGDITSEMDL